MLKYHKDKDKDFLLNDLFITWRETLDTAIRKFTAEKINNFAESEQEKLLQRVLADIRHSRERRRRIIYWSAAAGIALLVVSSLFIRQYGHLPTQQDTSNIEAIVGQEMTSNNIRLILGEKVMDLKQNAQIALNDDGRISVTEATDVSEMALSENVMNRLIVPSGKRSSLQLSDGTKMWLNSGTELDFPSKFGNSTREISMKGEIYIEVAKGKTPFYVNTSQFRVRVHGTKFNISAYGQNEENSVVLVEGSVEIVTADLSPTMLAPNEKAVVNTGEILKETVNVDEYTLWKDGVLISMISKKS